MLRADWLTPVLPAKFCWKNMASRNLSWIFYSRIYKENSGIEPCFDSVCSMRSCCRAMLCISVPFAVVRRLSRSCIVSKRLNIRPQLLWNVNRKLYQCFQMVPFSMTLNDLEWLSKFFNDTKHRGPLCDSWSFCRVYRPSDHGLTCQVPGWPWIANA